MPTSLGTVTCSMVDGGGAVEVVATVVVTVGRETPDVGAGVARPESLVVGLSSSLKATTPRTTDRAARTTYQRRHHGPLDDGPPGGGDPHPAGRSGGGGPQPCGLTRRSGIAPP